MQVPAFHPRHVRLFGRLSLVSGHRLGRHRMCASGELNPDLSRNLLK